MFKSPKHFSALLLAVCWDGSCILEPTLATHICLHLNCFKTDSWRHWISEVNIPHDSPIKGKKGASLANRHLRLANMLHNILQGSFNSVNNDYETTTDATKLFLLECLSLRSLEVWFSSWGPSPHLPSTPQPSFLSISHLSTQTRATMAEFYTSWNIFWVVSNVTARATPTSDTSHNNICLSGFAVYLDQHGL